MLAPVERLKKSEIIQLRNRKCKKHRHSYLDHYQCFLTDKNEQPKIGFLDIETSNLNGDFGFIFSYCILSDDGKMFQRILSPKEIKSGEFDKNLLHQFCLDIKKFDKVITHYGDRFDGPFLRTRALLYGCDFPKPGMIRHVDMWMVLRKKFKLRNNRLQTYCDFYGIASKKHPMNPRQWQRANAGDPAALRWILTHNKEDVTSTAKLYRKLSPFVREGQNYL